MINFFNQKKVQNVEIEEKFKWISKIDEQKKELINQDIKIRFDEIETINNFFSMPNGKNHLQKLYNDMVSSGFPKISFILPVGDMSFLFHSKISTNTLSPTENGKDPAVLNPTDIVILTSLVTVLNPTVLIPTPLLAFVGIIVG